MKLTRRETYELVWNAPLTVVAGLLDVSSVSLGKTCERRGIPTPARGYWQKVSAGHELPSRPRLGDVEAELPMPWDHNPAVDAALARMRTVTDASVHKTTGEATADQQCQERATLKNQASDEVVPQGELGSVPLRQGDGFTAHSFPADINAAIDLARRLVDLQALESLTERALEAGAVLPACEEQRLRSWVARTKAAMREMDPLLLILESARHDA